MEHHPNGIITAIKKVDLPTEVDKRKFSSEDQ
jgi:hypothetical protein